MSLTRHKHWKMAMEAFQTDGTAVAMILCQDHPSSCCLPGLTVQRHSCHVLDAGNMLLLLMYYYNCVPYTIRDKTTHLNKVHMSFRHLLIN